MQSSTSVVLLAAVALLSGPVFAGEPTPVTPAPAAGSPAGVPLVTQEALLARQAQHDRALFVLDVRTADEFAQGHVPGAVNIPHDQVASRLAEVPKDQDVVLYCRSGRRADLAAEVLATHDYARLLHLEGDMNAWLAQGRPIQAKAPPEAIPP